MDKIHGKSWKIHVLAICGSDSCLARHKAAGNPHLLLLSQHSDPEQETGH